MTEQENKIAFIYDMPEEHAFFWDDGLRAALRIIEREPGWSLDYYNMSLNPDIVTENYDFGLFWGAFQQEQHGSKHFKKQGLCFGGGTTKHENSKNFDIVFAESRIDLKAFEHFGINTLKAFGTNTDLFKPMFLKKHWDYIYPAAFAKWKRHDIFAEEVKGKKALAIGHIQPDGWEKECYEICIDSGVAVMDWVPVKTLVWLYNQSNKCLVTADKHGGGQRTVLEAIACGIPVEVKSESDKLLELKYLTRDEVLRNWSHESYAKQLMKGIKNVVEA